MEYHSAIKRNKLLIHAIEWMTLDAFGQMKQTGSKRLCFHLFNILEKDTLGVGTENRSVITRPQSTG